MDVNADSGSVREVLADELKTRQVVADLPEQDAAPKETTPTEPEVKPKVELEAFEKKVSKTGTYKPKKKEEKKDSDDTVENFGKNLASTIPIEVKPEIAEPQGDPIIAPPSMKPEEKAEFAKLPYAQKAFLARIVRDEAKTLNQKFQEISAVKRFYEGLDRKIAPYSQELALQGIPVENAIESALAWDQLQRRDPTEFVRQVIDLNRGKIDFRKLGFSQASPQNGMQQGQVQIPQQWTQEPQAQANPEVEELRNQVNFLMQGVTQQQQGVVKQFYTNWTDAKDEAGNLLHPYLEELGDSFRQKALILTKDPSVTIENLNAVLDDAYELALRANPDIRDAMKQRQDAAAQAKQLAEAKAKIVKAEKASASYKGSGGGAMTPSKMGLHDTIAAHVKGQLT